MNAFFLLSGLHKHQNMLMNLSYSYPPRGSAFKQARLLTFLVCSNERKEQPVTVQSYTV